MGCLSVSDEVLARVEAFAFQGGVPVEQQAKKLLHESLTHHAAKRELRKTMAAIAVITPPDVKQTDSFELFREARNR